MKTPEQPTPSPQAAEVYEQNYAQIGQMLIHIGTLVEAEHKSSEPKTWGHVGDQGYVMEQLKQVIQFMETTM